MRCHYWCLVLEIRLLKVALLKFYVSSLFLWDLCAQKIGWQWVKLKELTTTDWKNEINLSCQEPLTCLFVGYSRVHMFCVRDSELGVIFRKGWLGWVSCHEYSLQPLEVRSAFVDNPLLLLWVWKNASPHPPMFPCHRGRIGMPWEKNMSNRELETPKEKHPIPGFWWLVICYDPKKKDWKYSLNHLFLLLGICLDERK